MARGYIYYVTSDKDIDPTFTESNYYDSLDSLGADYVQDCDEEDSVEQISWFEDKLKGMGAVISTDNLQDGFSFSFRFDRVNEMQQAYFKIKLEKLKEEASKLTLFDVIRSAPTLDYITNDTYGDMVEFCGVNSSATITVDNMVRQIEPGVTYYVCNKTILMH